MSRRSLLDISFDNLFGCDHKPTTPVYHDGVIVYYLCQCGRKHLVPYGGFKRD